MPIKLIRKVLGFNRRGGKRLTDICIAKYTLVGSSKKDKPIYVNILDLSTTGVSMATVDKKLEPKTKIDIDFDLPWGKRILVQGEVAWTRSEMDRIFKSGVKFLDIKESDAEAIKTFIASRSKPKK